MKFSAKFLACTLLLIIGMSNTQADDDCDALCEIGNWFDDLGDDITQVYNVVAENTFG